MTSELEKRLQDLAQGRARLLQAHSRAEDCRARLEKSKLYQEVAEANGEALRQKAALAEKEQAARKAVVEAFLAAGAKDKKVASGASIREGRIYRYEIENVLAWAKEHAPLLVVERVDDKAFEREAEFYRKKGAPVEIGVEYTAALASDLSAYLEGWEG